MPYYVDEEKERRRRFNEALQSVDDDTTVEDFLESIRLNTEA